MAGTRTPSKPSFFWQGLMIVLPVVVLVAVGVSSLRQDRRLAQREAEDRARAIAEDLVPLIWNELTARETNGLPQPSFTVDANGQLIFPPARDAVPTPNTFDLTVLNPEQARLWQALQRAEAVSQSDESRIETYDAFIDSNPPDNFAADAHYRLGLWFTRQTNLVEAAERFDLVVEDYSEATGESGLSLRQLALMKLLEIEPRETTDAPKRVRRPGSKPPVRAIRYRSRNQIEPHFPPVELDHYVSLDYVCSNFVCHPTPLTPYLLQELQERWISETKIQDTIRKWQRVWDEHELSRELFTAAREHFRTNVGVVSLPALGAAKNILVEEDQAQTTNRLLSAATASQSRVNLPHLFWFDTPTGLKTSIPGDGINPSRLEIEELHWLALRSADAADRIRYVCLAESEIGLRMRDLLQQVKSLPSYFGVGIELTGRTVNEFAPNIRLWHYRHYAGKGGHVDRQYQGEFATNILASATRQDADANLLRVNVFLTSPGALFESQRSRAFSFGVLIATAAVAAAIGLLAAWRAFNRQLRLGEMKSNFVSSVSHELRAPIASVRLLAESLERGTVSEPTKQNEYFRFIGQECRRLSSLIENVLDFSRIEQGRKQYEFEPTDVGALVEQTVKLMQPYAAEKGVRLELGTFNIQPSTSSTQSSEPGKEQFGAHEFPAPGLSATLSPSAGENHGVMGNPQPPALNLELNLDGRAIQQAVVNLIDNAIKHSPKDAVVAVGLETRSAECVVRSDDVGTVHRPPSTVNLSVTDHGPGIPASEQEKIFERFYRLGSELRRETQGVGIGLSIVKHIVEAHGGCVRVESEPGKGSCFTIELPGNSETEDELK